jgi:hypothetical protein
VEDAIKKLGGARKVVDGLLKDLGQSAQKISAAQAAVETLTKELEVIREKKGGKMEKER